MTPELPVIGFILPGIRLAVEGLAAFTNEQRWSIREERDQGKCQFPPHLNGHKHECHGRLEVHHIIPQRYAGRLGIDPDYPENALTICQNAHSEIHPDMKQAKHLYGVNKQSYQEMFQAREETLEKNNHIGIPNMTVYCTFRLLS